MNSKTLLRGILFLPYLAWLIAIPLANLPTTPMFSFAVVGVSGAYLVGIVFWGIPYTILVIGLLLWSGNKSAKEFDAVLPRSPLLMALLTVAELSVLYLYYALTSQIRLSPFMDFLGFTWFLLLGVVGSFIFGYAFFFLGKAIYRVFGNLRLIKEENESVIDISDASV
jgi:hypothetical protein